MPDILAGRRLNVAVRFQAADDLQTDPDGAV